MTTIVPNDELLRKAVRYIDELLREQQEPVDKALEKAALQFNLGPAQCEYLRSLFKERPDNT